MCMRRIRVMATDASSPVVLVRLLCREVRDSRGVEGVGVIGMCLTGNFAITLIGDDSVLALSRRGRLCPSSSRVNSICRLRRSRHRSPRHKSAMHVLRFEDDPLYYREVRCITNLQYRWSGTHKRDRVTGQRPLCAYFDFVDKGATPPAKSPKCSWLFRREAKLVLARPKSRLCCARDGFKITTRRIARLAS